MADDQDKGDGKVKKEEADDDDDGDGGHTSPERKGRTWRMISN